MGKEWAGIMVLGHQGSSRWLASGRACRLGENEAGDMEVEETGLCKVS